MFSIDSKKFNTEIYCMNCKKMKNLKSLKCHTFFKKTLFLPIICSKCGKKDEKIFKEKESIKISKFVCLITNLE